MYILRVQSGNLFVHYYFYRGIRPMALRLLLQTRTILRPRRLFHTSSIMSKEQIDELEKNPFYEKYAGKISKLQKTSPEEFLKRLGEAEDQRKKASNKFGPGGKPIEEKDFSMPSNAPKPSTSSAGSGMVQRKTLDDKMKLSLVKDKSTEEISEIWRQYHANKDAVSAVIPIEMYSEMKLRFKEFPTFLFPLPRKQGYEFVVVQFDGDVAHFTTLINYQAFKENAPECLTIDHFPELAEEKGIVLMVGEYDKNVLVSSI